MTTHAGRIGRCNHRFEFHPGHDLLYLRQKLLAARNALLRSKLGARKTGLFHGRGGISEILHKMNSNAKIQ
jgi:hypothetical protein